MSLGSATPELPRQRFSSNCRQNQPDHESQLTPLVGFTGEQALQAWERAVQNAAGRRTTARIAKSAVRELNLTATGTPVERPRRPNKKGQRRLVSATMVELLTLLNQKADHVTVIEKAQALYQHIRTAFAVMKRSSVRR